MAANEPESTRYNAEFYCRYRDMIFDTDLPLDERDYAVEQMTTAAQSGNPYAQHLLGKLYRDGTVVIPDVEQARDWLQRSAEQSLNVARYALGKLLLTDDPLVQDIPAGLNWLEQARQNGSSYAGYRLGKEYLRGEIVPKDVPKALEYLNDSAQRGNQFAQYTLGKLFLLGREVPQDKGLAERWLKLSAAQGNEYAQFFLDRLDQFRCGRSAVFFRTTPCRSPVRRASATPTTSSVSGSGRRKWPWATRRMATRNTKGRACPCDSRKPLGALDILIAFRRGLWYVLCNENPKRGELYGKKKTVR